MRKNNPPAALRGARGSPKPHRMMAKLEVKHSMATSAQKLTSGLVVQLAGLDDAALQHGKQPVLVLQQGNICDHIAIHDEDVGDLSDLQGANLVSNSHDLRTCAGGTGNCFKGCEADIIHEKTKLPGIVTVRIPGETEIPTHAKSSPVLENLAGTFRSSLQGFLVAVNDPLRETPFRSLLDTGLLKIESGDDRDIPLQEQIESLLVHEGPVFNRVITCQQGIADPLGGPAMPGDFHGVIVGCRDNRLHLLESHAESVVIIGVRGRRIAGGIGFDPLDAVLDSSSSEKVG